MDGSAESRCIIEPQRRVNTADFSYRPTRHDRSKVWKTRGEDDLWAADGSKASSRLRLSLSPLVRKYASWRVSQLKSARSWLSDMRVVQISEENWEASLVWCPGKLSSRNVPRNDWLASYFCVCWGKWAFNGWTLKMLQIPRQHGMWNKKRREAGELTLCACADSLLVAHILTLTLWCGVVGNEKTHALQSRSSSTM